MKIDKLGCFINKDQNLIFDINSSAKIIFQKTNCEGSEKPSVLSMWGSCFSSINAMVRDIKKGGNSHKGVPYYIQKAEQVSSRGNLEEAEYFYNQAL